MAYDGPFFDNTDRWALSSAQVMVPLILDLSVTRKALTNAMWRRLFSS